MWWQTVNTKVYISHKLEGCFFRFLLQLKHQVYSMNNQQTKAKWNKGHSTVCVAVHIRLDITSPIALTNNNVDHL